MRMRSSAPVTGSPSKRQDDVAGYQARPFGRTSRFDRGDHNRTLLGEAGRMPTAAGRA